MDIEMTPTPTQRDEITEVQPSTETTAEIENKPLLYESSRTKPPLSHTPMVVSQKLATYSTGILRHWFKLPSKCMMCETFVVLVLSFSAAYCASIPKLRNILIFTIPVATVSRHVSKLVIGGLMRITKLLLRRLLPSTLSKVYTRTSNT